MKVKRFALAAATATTIGAVSILALSSTSFGSAMLRSASHNLMLTAHAGGGGGGGNMYLTISPNASLLGKVAADVQVTYSCDELFDAYGNIAQPYEVSGNLYLQVTQRTGNSAATGSAFANLTNVSCFPGAVNTADAVVTPTGASFKNGTAVAQVLFASVCSNGGYSSFGPGPCDSGQTNATVISIKS
jgi:hypothetical protein